MTPATEYIYRLIGAGYNTTRKLIGITGRVRGTIGNHILYLEEEGKIERIKPGLYKCI